MYELNRGSVAWNLRPFPDARSSRVTGMQSISAHTCAAGISKKHIHIYIEICVLNHIRDRSGSGGPEADNDLFYQRHRPRPIEGRTPEHKTMSSDVTEIFDRGGSMCRRSQQYCSASEYGCCRCSRCRALVLSWRCDRLVHCS